MKVKYINLDSAEEWIFFGVLGGRAEKATHQGLSSCRFLQVTSLTTRLLTGHGLVKSSVLRKH